MDLSTIITSILLPLTLSLIATFLMNKSKKRNLEASSDNLVIQSSEKVLLMVQSQLHTQQLEIEALRQEIELLKDKEKLHISERNRMEARIKVLMDDNNNLKALNKAGEDEILKLRLEIEALSKDLNKKK